MSAASQVVGGQVFEPPLSPPPADLSFLEDGEWMREEGPEPPRTRVELLVVGEEPEPQVYRDFGPLGMELRLHGELFVSVRDGDGGPVDLGVFNARGEYRPVLAPVTVSWDGGMWQELAAPVVWLNSLMRRYDSFRRRGGEAGLWQMKVSEHAALERRIVFEPRFLTARASAERMPVTYAAFNEAGRVKP